MGNNCGKEFPNPDTTNVCSDNIGQDHTIAHFCTIAGPAGDNYRESYCERIGSPGEWKFDTQANLSSCNYNDCKPYQKVDSGCCNGCCGIIGENAVCKRNKFNGNPLTCCFNDYNCKGDPDLCWSDPGKKNTCDPKYRNIRTTGCQDLVYDYCTGADLTNPGDLSWMDRWRNPSDGKPVPNLCLYALQTNLFSIPANPCGNTLTPTSCTPVTQSYSAIGYLWASRLVEGVFTKYGQAGYVIGSLPGDRNYNSFQEFIQQHICCHYPALCANGLGTACALYTAQKLTLNPSAVSWCGCYLPEGEYQRYVDKYQINKECTPMCNRSDTIPLVDANAKPKRCQQNICLIDNVNVQLTSTTLNNGQGNVDLSQYCGNCNGSTKSCSCIMEYNSFLAANSVVGGDIDFSQQCSSATCTTNNPNEALPNTSSTFTIPCDQEANYDPLAQYNNNYDKAASDNKRSTLTVIIIVLACILGIIILGLLIFSPTATTRSSSGGKRSPPDGRSSDIRPGYADNIGSLSLVKQL